MTPADKRILEQLDRWLASIELHLKYVDLDEASYRQIQPWPDHERPARWILELAQQKILQLKTLCKAHISSHDQSFAESLELMSFLANLVGAQNIKRFIPVADPAREQLGIPSAENERAKQFIETKSSAIDDNSTREIPFIPSALRRQSEGEHTREMPKLKVANKKANHANARAGLEATGKRTVHKPAAAPAAVGSVSTHELVIADAVRLLKWGREWHELTELIARMAERPAAGEIRRILRNYKASIEAQLRA
jgi:hypothetical protein